MLMLTKTHAAVVAAKEAEIAGLMKRIGTLLETQRTDLVRIRGLKDRCNDLWTAKDAVEAKLAVFTAPRARNDRGHFVSAKEPVQ
jgi:hypothetical protein